MNAQTYYGLNCGWGLGTTAFAISGALGIYQSTDHELKLDENEVRDQRGNVVSWTGYNPVENVTIEYIPTDIATAAGNAALTYPDRGSKMNITGADGPVAGTGWIVKDVNIKKTNTDVVKIIIKATRYLAIA